MLYLVFIHSSKFGYKIEVLIGGERNCKVHMNYWQRLLKIFIDKVHIFYCVQFVLIIYFITNYRTALSIVLPCFLKHWVHCCKFLKHWVHCCKTTKHESVLMATTEKYSVQKWIDKCSILEINPPEKTFPIERKKPTKAFDPICPEEKEKRNKSHTTVLGNYPSNTKAMFSHFWIQGSNGFSQSLLSDLDDSRTDQFLDLVHHKWVLHVFLGSFRVLLQVRQHLVHYWIS